MPADLTVLVPCFNEEARIDRTLEGLWEWSAGHPDLGLEILLSDDGSTDATVARIDAWSARWSSVRRVGTTENRGKGAALRHGVAAARGRLLVFFDADLAVGVSHLDPALELLESGADVAVGCRNVPGAVVERPQGRGRRWLGRGYLALARFVLGLGVPDVTCGFKGFRIDAARTLFARSRCNRFGFDAEVLALAERGGYRVETFPVTWVDGDRSTVRLRRDVLGALAELVATRVRIGFGAPRTEPIAPGEPASASE